MTDIRTSTGRAQLAAALVARARRDAPEAETAEDFDHLLLATHTIDDQILRIDGTPQAIVAAVCEAAQTSLDEVVGVYAAEADRLRSLLANPAPGWFTLGTHADQPGVQLEFWGQDDDLPVWERPVDADGRV